MLKLYNFYSLVPPVRVRESDRVPDHVGVGADAAVITEQLRHEVDDVGHKVFLLVEVQLAEAVRHVAAFVGE